MHNAIEHQMRDAFGWTGALTAAQRLRLQRKHFLAIGFGSLMRPLSERLVELGALDFTLVDPQRYTERSIATQCAADEVGELKVEVGRRLLAARGARAIVYPVDAAAVPHGAVHENTIVIASVDNPRGDLLANRIAAPMQSLMIKLNVEPAFGIAAIRAYDFRRSAAICVECQFSDKQHYAQQRHPRSCDGTAQRPSSTPRPLAQLAAELGAVAAVDCLDESRIGAWLRQEVQCSLDFGVTRSRLDAKEHCRWDHERRWHPRQRLSVSPEAISLAELVRLAAVVVDGATSVRFCHDVATRSRCEACGHESARPRWTSDLGLPAACPLCEGPLHAIPFFAQSSLPLESLAEVMSVPLADWGVPVGAAVELSESHGRRQSFIIGSDRQIKLCVGALTAAGETI